MIFQQHLMLAFSAATASFTMAAAAQLNPSTSPALAAPSAAALYTDTTDSANDIVQAARAAARTDRNRESVVLFTQAIALEPARRFELRQEYADQLLYSNLSSQAIPLYEEVLAAPRSKDEKLRALKGLGNAYLWSERASQARPLFEVFLQEDPSNRDVQRSLGRALSWSGRQREAIAYLQQYLRDHPADQEARLLLAQSQVWMGRDDLAAQTLQGVSADRQDARALREVINRNTGPHTVADTQQSRQSDQVNIHSLRLSHALDFADGRGTAGLRLEQTNYARDDQSDSAEVSRPMVIGRYRLSDAFEINTEVGRERISPRASDQYQTTVYSSWLTWWPSDLYRFDLSSNRSSFDNLQSLRLGITVNQRALSIDVTPSEKQHYNAKITHANYSDGNARRDGQLQAQYRFLSQPETWIGLKHTRFAFDRQSNNGYFNPLRFESTQFTLRNFWRPDGPDGRWELTTNLAFGREHAQADGNKPTSELSLRAGYKLNAETRLEARLQRFSSRTLDSGFSRSTFGVTLLRTWR
jgi:tetratricopeptide (TPR) repeat protein